jgi:hypothetical protein
VLKPTGTVVIFAMEPLTSTLVQSQLDQFLYKQYWLRKATNILGPHQGRPLDMVEEIAVFSRVGKSERTYNPQITELQTPLSRLMPRSASFFLYRTRQAIPARQISHARHPVNIIVSQRTRFDSPWRRQSLVPPSP